MKRQWTTGEFAAALGITTRRFLELRSQGAPIPKPSARLGNNLLWDAAVVRGALPALRAYRRGRRQAVSS
ncbi:hypothetical protein WKW79_13690 [Variovorax robiniae]|uniref:DNA-binding protein n=1 Tax=Variovorax robiniae TaxID=1836199 RepID=A0ABU8X760_9BURK